MMKRLILSALAVFAVACGGAPQTQTEIQNKDQQARSALSSMYAKDPSLAGLVNSSAGYIVFPNIGKAGLGVGAALGTGVLYQNGQRVGFVRLEQGSIGLQAGAQSYQQLVILRDQFDVERVKNNRFTFGANASAVALTAGAGAATSQHRRGTLLGSFVQVVPLLSGQAEASARDCAGRYDHAADFPARIRRGRCDILVRRD
jgi:lipid-binding SYLF domain-containing protein